MSALAPFEMPGFQWDPIPDILFRAPVTSYGKTFLEVAASERCDVMALAIHPSADQKQAMLLIGLRSGTVMGYYFDMHGLLHVSEKAFQKVAISAPQHVFSYRSQGAVCHIEFVNATEFIASYTNGDMVLADASRLSDPPLCQYKGHCNHYSTGLARFCPLTPPSMTKPTEKTTVQNRKAHVATKLVTKGSSGQKVLRKVRTSASFYRPHTLRLPRNPKYPRKSAPHAPRTDAYKVLLFPVNTESAMKKIEEVNTLVFIVARHANKYQIKQALKEAYDVDSAKVNTLIRPDGKKKAFIRLTPDQDALDVSNRIGFI
ncbi:60S ribosomal protein L25 [Malassezia vespertilionis]|uniref:60S ribosomal protein L25 n=1 Tax=Malassezia vespertilionis TaxID=2020962 RepID=UPI0024B12D82|nr:60S ribosomal protein L25 [Malassezia vespertilionis]WFD07663.1 60S ribosomal protein L25 [Malassezia vespertilionis]